MGGYKRYIVWKKSPKAAISQIYSKGMEFALVSQDYKQCNPFVWCKDFLQDVVYSALHKKWINIYDFQYSPYTDPEPCLDKVRILVANANDSKLRNKIPNVIDILNQIEDTLDIKKSFVRECWMPPENYRKSGVWMFEGSKRWLKSPPMLSLYTLLLRVGCVHTVGVRYEKTLKDIMSQDIKPYQKKDALWLKHSMTGIEKIIRIGDRKIFHSDIKDNYPNLDIDVIHNQLGIAGFSSDIQDKLKGRPVAVPYWHYLK